MRRLLSCFLLVISPALSQPAAPSANPPPQASPATRVTVQTPPAPASSAPASERSAASPVAQTAPPAQPLNPHAQDAARRNESQVASDLPAGTVEVRVLGATGAPLNQARIRLGIIFQKISEGESRTERFATTDASGRARFSGLTPGSDFSYRVSLKSGPAEYGSPPFNLDSQSGHRVQLHAYSATGDIEQAQIALRGLLYIEPRDEVFQFDALFLVMNVGLVAWVPEAVTLKLPKGFKAFSAQKEMSGAGFVLVDGIGARLEGTFSPGQHEVRFRFQLPKEARETVSFQLGTLPRIADFRVIAEASTRMGLHVEGFGPAEPGTSPEGKRVLVTSKDFTRTEALKSLDLELRGLPVPGVGRWIAVAIAVALGLGGFGASRGLIRLEAADARRRDRDLDTARELLLAEIVEVEKSRRSGELGARAYAEARRMLLDSLARLGLDALTIKRAPRPSSSS